MVSQLCLYVAILGNAKELLTLTIMTARQQAMLDMTEAGISISVFSYEKVIIELTKTEESVRIDFRAFNGGYHKKHTNQHEDK